MSESNQVRMNIPRDNPLFDWVLWQDLAKPMLYATVIVGDVTARLALTAVHSHRWSCGDREPDYLDTEWILLRSG